MDEQNSKSTKGRVFSFWEETKRLVRDELFRRIKQSKRLNALVDLSDFELPAKSWRGSGHVVSSIILASLLINILSLAFPLALLQIYDRIIPNVAMNTLVLLVIGVGIALILEALMRISRSYVGAWADAKFEHIIGCQAFKRIMESYLLVFEREGSGKHMKRLNAISTLRDFYAGQAIVSVIDMPFVLVLLALIAYIAGWLVLVPVAMLTIFLFSAVKNARHLKVILDDRQDQDDRRSNFIIETLSNIHTVKSITMEAQMQRRYERLQRTNAVNDHDLSLQGAKSMGISTSISQLTIIAVVAFGSILVINGLLTIGGLAACTLLSGRCLQPVNLLVGLWSRLQAIKIAREDLDKVLSLEQESAPNLPDISGFKGEIEFKNVSFRYSDKSKWTLKDINLKIPERTAISITGAGEGGKSTLMWLLMGMLRPQEGEILLDGQDSSKFNASSYRKLVAYLPQLSVLFNGTIMENLTLFEEETFHDQAVAAAGAVGLSGIIEHLANGYDTQVADQAIEALPRGINQRIAIARALTFQPAIVIFDEANTAMDMRGDAIIRSMLKKIVGKCTLILISHRPSILELAEKHYVMEAAELREVQK